MDVHPADVAVAGVVEYVEATFRPLTAEKDLRFAVQIADDVPRMLFSDQHRLQQVLRNLLSNAVKFTSTGEVRMDIRTAADEPFTTAGLNGDRSVIAFSVTDTGIGIPPEQLKVIFEAFQQADGTISRKYGGTGLGLSISREIARLIGGEIHVESEPGRGSTFTLYLPLRYAGDAPKRRPHGRSGDRPPHEGVPPGAPSTRPWPTTRAPSTATTGSCSWRSPTGQRAAAVDVGREHGFKVLATPNRTRRSRSPGGTSRRRSSSASTSRAGRGVAAPCVEGRHRTRHIPAVAIPASQSPEDVHVARLLGALAVVELPVTPETLGVALTTPASNVSRRTRSLLVVANEWPRRDLRRDRALRLGPRRGPARGDRRGGRGCRPRQPCLRRRRARPEAPGRKRVRRAQADELAQGVARHPAVVSPGEPLSKRDSTRLAQYARSMVVRQPQAVGDLMDEIALLLHRSDVELPTTAEPATTVSCRWPGADILPGLPATGFPPSPPSRYAWRRCRSRDSFRHPCKHSSPGGCRKARSRGGKAFPPFLPRAQSVSGFP